MGVFGSPTPSSLARGVPRTTGEFPFDQALYTAPGVRVPAGSLDNWFAARNAASTRLVEVVMFGDSTWYGQTLSGPYYSPLQRIRERLVAAGYADGGHGNHNGVDDVTSTGDSLTIGAGFASGNVFVLPGESAYSDVSGDNQTFTRTGRYLTIWWSRFNSGGRFTYEIDSSGTEIVVDPAYPNASVYTFAHSSVIDLGTTGTHTIKFRNKGGRLVTAPTYNAATLVPAGSGGTLPTGTYEYRMAFANAGGQTGPLGPVLTAPVTLGQQVTLVLLAQPDGFEVNTRYYRRVAGVGTYKLIATVATNSGSPYVYTDTGAAAGADYIQTPDLLNPINKWVNVATVVTKDKGIVLHNLAARGSASAMASNTFNNAIAFGLDLEPPAAVPATSRAFDTSSGARHPVLTILTHGINDQQGSPADNSAAYGANLVTAIRAARYAGDGESDVLVTLPCWETAVNQSNASLYRAAGKAAAEGEGVPWIDIGIGGALPSVVPGATTNPHLTLAQYQAQGDFIWDQVLGRR